MQGCARGVLLTETGLVLLMKIVGAGGEVWVTPGGRIRPGEDAAEAAIREKRGSRNSSSAVRSPRSPAEDETRDGRVPDPRISR
jgi:ADP-ribose pyrophosphatase YjhB (NUDIX family)